MARGHLFLFLLAALACAALAAGSDRVRSETWEDATLQSIQAARNCLPDTLTALYLDKLAAATAATTDPRSAVECEALILGYTYQYLSGALDLCKAFSRGEYQCARFISSYDDPETKNLIPAAFPDVAPLVFQEECELALLGLPVGERDQILEDFRYRFAPGVQCLRDNTVHAFVLDLI